MRGARKIRELLVRRLDGDIKVPAKSTIHAVLDRHSAWLSARGTPLPQEKSLVQVDPGLHTFCIQAGVGAR